VSDACFDVSDRLLSLEEALDFLLSRARPLTETEELDALDGLGRILARGVTAELDVPPWDNSAMDGYAVRAEDLPASGEAVLPISQRTPAGAGTRPGTTSAAPSSAPTR
jgi:molybdopterin molybdotransferase